MRITCIMLWDLPLHALLGGRQVETLPLYNSISCLVPDAIAEIAREAKAEGSRQFQAKFGADGD
ncbi:MAG: hypothetical protein ACR2RE_12230 [Geminicoccaceae bacterium]